MITGNHPTHNPKPLIFSLEPAKKGATITHGASAPGFMPIQNTVEVVFEQAVVLPATQTLCVYVPAAFEPVLSR